MNLKFYKDIITLKWYVYLPEFDGEIEELEMVMGADLMLEILGQGSDTVYVDIYTEEPDLYNVKLESTNDNLADCMTYISKWRNNSDFEVWLCKVTEFVFGNFPNTIYIK